MLAIYKLYYCPKSNTVFFPNRETEPVDPKVDNMGGFDVIRLKTYAEDPKHRPIRFDAVFVAGLTWNNALATKKSDLLAKLKENPFKDKRMRSRFQTFLDTHLAFMDTRYAETDECTEGIPNTAVRKD